MSRDYYKTNIYVGSNRTTVKSRMEALTDSKDVLADKETGFRSIIFSGIRNIGADTFNSFAASLRDELTKACRRMMYLDELSPLHANLPDVLTRYELALYKKLITECYFSMVRMLLEIDDSNESRSFEPVDERWETRKEKLHCILFAAKEMIEGIYYRVAEKDDPNLPDLLLKTQQYSEIKDDLDPYDPGDREHGEL